MKKAPIPKDEKKRIQSVLALDILDSSREERFDRITRLASSYFEAPIATITIVDSNREWHKSTCGPIEGEGERDLSFCGHTILEDEMVILDTTKDDRFHDNPMVTGKEHIRFYAGITLKSTHGDHLGTLCIKDIKTRVNFDEKDQQILITLAKWAELELNIVDLKEAMNLREKLIEQTMQLEQAEEYKSFVTTLTHQLRTPVNTILWQIEALGEGEKMNTLDKIENIYSRTKSLNKIIGNLVDYLEISDSYEKKEEIEMSIFDFVTFLTQEYSNNIAQKGIQLDIDLDDVTIKVDKDSFKRVLMIFFDNAITYNKDGGTFRIKSQIQKNHITLSVSDTGYGIPKNEHSQVFSKFFRAKNASYGKNEGSGVSLYISKVISDVNNWNISFESDEDVGTTFTIDIPLVSR